MRPFRVTRSRNPSGRQGLGPSFRLFPKEWTPLWGSEEEGSRGASANESPLHGRLWEIHGSWF